MLSLLLLVVLSGAKNCSSLRIVMASTRSRRALSLARPATGGQDCKDAFYQLPLFAVVGASNDENKFGNKVLRCYKQNGKQVVPINKVQRVIEGISCYDSLSALSVGISSSVFHGVRQCCEVGVSMVTPPGVTRMILEEGVALGYTHFYLQPGTHDASVRAYIDLIRADNLHVFIQDCVLIDFGYKH